MNTLFESALLFLDKNEPLWELSKPINRRKYLQGLINNLNDELIKIKYSEELNDLTDNDLYNETNL